MRFNWYSHATWKSLASTEKDGFAIYRMRTSRDCLETLVVAAKRNQPDKYLQHLLIINDVAPAILTFG